MSGNFAFLEPVWPLIYKDAARAESYLHTDPRSACFYARRTVELVVDGIYRLCKLPEPYRSDLAARIDADAFHQAANPQIIRKMTVIRQRGNDAVHQLKETDPRVAQFVLTELHHVLLWAAYRYSGAGPTLDMRATFDPALAPQAAPLTRDELIQLNTLLEQKDAEAAAARAASEQQQAELEQQLEQARAELAAAKQQLAADPRDYTENQTRDLFIDQLLHEAGWPLDSPRDREYPVTGMPTPTGQGYVDYVLWGADGKPLAVVEAKKTTLSVQVGLDQASRYADALQAQFGRRPVIFCTNGVEHYLWDDAAGYPPRPVRGFYTRDQLETLIRRRTTRVPLAQVPVNRDIAGRPYQLRAIAAIGEALENKRRAALLVMATGTGKTRTAIALVDQLSRAGWVKRALFLADRQSLVKQAADAFVALGFEGTTVNLLTSRHGEGRIYASTYPTMMNLIQQSAPEGARFDPGYFDLVIIDEAHRSVYAKYGEIFEHFDALLVGLTATPKDEVDRNTYRLFELEPGVPTDAYSLDEAVRDGWLVPPRGVSVGTQFLREGIRYDDLSEQDQETWDALDWGEGDTPEEVSSEEINRFLFNADTVDQVLATLMDQGRTVADGEHLGKTIIFAKNQAHADFILERFNAQWPELGGRFAQVITHASRYPDEMIEDFKIPGKAPHIAISVDMLDTGIDVPEVVNLVFFKMLRSKTKFWQMIGRGTRLCPDLYGPGKDKEDFLVFDFCQNLEYFNQDLPESPGSTQRSLTQRLFEDRLDLIVVLDAGATGVSTEDARTVRASAAEQLEQAIGRLTLDNVLVRPHRRALEEFQTEGAFEQLTVEKAERVRPLAGLITGTPGEDIDAKRFDLLIVRRQLAQLTGDIGTGERIRTTVQSLAENLLGKESIPSVRAQRELLEAISSEDWWQDVTLGMLEHARRQMRGLIQFVEHQRRSRVYTDFADTLTEIEHIDVKAAAPGVDEERFWAKVTEPLRRDENQIAVAKLRHGRQLTEQDLESLEDILRSHGADDQILDHAKDSAEGHLGLFLRQLVGLDRSAAQGLLVDIFVGDSLTAAQHRFIDNVITELTANGVMDAGRLFESPYTDDSRDGPFGLFEDAQVISLRDCLAGVRRTAIVGPDSDGDAGASIGA
ncbi:DEAD/DEAH box helicase family protein [Brachybacterium sp. Marseille-Q7125]|uniref:DEAD/DEAH box helicase family protein n=1 Tax=Brachybacterium sp. Marseille-Q7125 TaxID=2932815 RepID=UPI001FF62D5B|nr:DEAD/DEAH box helicase family protein [Brachybacterium sp. Marseille-Q7125]